MSCSSVFSAARLGRIFGQYGPKRSNSGFGYSTKGDPWLVGDVFKSMCCVDSAVLGQLWRRSDGEAGAVSGRWARDSWML